MNYIVKKYYKIFIIALFINILLILNLCLSSELTEDNLSGLNDKYFNIYNPINAARSIIDKNGKVIIKTIGVEDPYAGYGERRQEDIGITLDVDTNEVYFYRIYDNQYITLYDEKMNLLLEKVENVKIKNGIIRFHDKYTKEIWDFDVNTKNKEKVEPIDYSKISSDSFLKKDELSKKEDKNKYPIVEIDDENFSIIKVKKNKYEFVSKKYDFKIEDIYYYTELTDKSVYNSKVFKLLTPLSTDYISNDGKLILRDFSDNKYEYNFVDNKYILAIYNRSKLKEKSTIHIYNYGDFPNVEEGSGEYVNFVVYHDKNDEVIKTDFSYISLDFITLDKDIYIKVNEKYGNKTTKLYDMKGNAKDIDCTLNTYTIKNNSGKYNLYDVYGKLLRKDLSSNEVYDLSEVKTLYKSLRSGHIVLINDKYTLIDSDGKIIVKDIDFPTINYDESYLKAYETNYFIYNGYPDNTNYLMVHQNLKPQIYDENGKILFKDLSGFKVYKSGNYYLLSKDGKYGIYNNKNNLLFEWSSALFPLDIYKIINYDRIYESFYSQGGLLHKYMDMNLILPESINHDSFIDINGDLCIYNHETKKYSLYDIDGNILLKDYKYLSRYDDNYILYVKGFEYGLIDRKGNKLFSLSIFDNSDDD